MREAHDVNKQSNASAASFVYTLLAEQYISH